MKNTTTAIALVLFLLFFAGCEEECTVSCFDYTNFLAIGYDSSELRTIIITSFTPDHTFSREVKTDTINCTWNDPHVFIHDTINLAGNLKYSYESDKDSLYDMEITIPADNRTYRISNITFLGPTTAQRSPDKSSHDCIWVRSHLQCSRILGSYNIDGTVVNNQSVIFTK